MTIRTKVDYLNLLFKHKDVLKLLYDVHGLRIQEIADAKRPRGQGKSQAAELFVNALEIVNREQLMRKISERAFEKFGASWFTSRDRLHMESFYPGFWENPES